MQLEVAYSVCFDSISQQTTSTSLCIHCCPRVFLEVNRRRFVNVNCYCTRCVSGHFAEFPIWFYDKTAHPWHFAVYSRCNRYKCEKKTFGNATSSRSSSYFEQKHTHFQGGLTQRLYGFDSLQFTCFPIQLYWKTLVCTYSNSKCMPNWGLALQRPKCRSVACHMNDHAKTGNFSIPPVVWTQSTWKVINATET